MKVSPRFASFSTLIVLLVIASSCDDRSADRLIITYDGFSVVDPSCMTTECAGVWASYPVFSGGSGSAADTANLFISDFVRKSITSFLTDDAPASPEDAARGFLNQYYDYINDFIDAIPGTPTPWQVSLSSTTVYETEGMVTIRFNEESYTGGAHPNQRVTLLSFDQQSGRILGHSDLFSNLDSLTVVAERMFRAARGLPTETDLEQAGYFFPENRFTLSRNMAVTDSGILLYYNPYEVAPYSFGPIELTLPIDSVEHFLRVR